MLLFFGIKWIGGLIGTAETMDATRFKVDIENAFDSIRPDYGTQRNHEFLVPANVDRICFVDTTTPSSQAASSNLCNVNHAHYDPFICNGWKDQTSGILMSPPNSQLDIGPIEMTGVKYLCFNTDTNSRLKIRLVSLGKSVRVFEQ